MLATCGGVGAGCSRRARTHARLPGGARCGACSCTSGMCVGAAIVGMLQAPGAGAAAAHAHTCVDAATATPPTRAPGWSSWSTEPHLHARPGRPPPPAARARAPRSRRGGRRGARRKSWSADSAAPATAWRSLRRTEGRVVVSERACMCAGLLHASAGAASTVALLLGRAPRRCIRHTSQHWLPHTTCCCSNLAAAMRLPVAGQEARRSPKDHTNMESSASHSLVASSARYKPPPPSAPAGATAELMAPRSVFSVHKAS